MDRKRGTYEGNKTKEISFPIGGIGSGCIGLAGNGQLIDWEIFNRPNKGSVNGFSHFAIKAERDGVVLGARVLQGDTLPSYMGKYGTTMFSGYGFGPIRETMAGVPHFRDVSFEGTYPFAQMSFSDPKFPGKAVLSAWNPLIPLNDHDSSLPAAFFEVTLENTEGSPIDYTVAFSVNNPLTCGSLQNLTKSVDGNWFMQLQSDAIETEDPSYGNLCVATDSADVGFQHYWFRGSWFDGLSVFWKDFSAPGKLKNREYPPNPSARNDMGTMTTHIQVEPGQSKTVRFVLTWSFPNNMNYWNPLPDEAAPGCGCESGSNCCATPASSAGKKACHMEKLVCNRL
jgi:non-lysosomal glucosylceramidase